jgi:hypothetical protein
MMVQVARQLRYNRWPVRTGLPLFNAYSLSPPC